MSQSCNNHRNNHRSNRAYYPRLLLLSMAVAACFSTGAIANPVAPTVVNGTASFNQAGNVLTVTNSNGAAINWNSFSIAAGETTRFVQPSASSSVLNRVLGGDPSSIYGTLSSNGRVWLVNPAGIMVGPSGRIDVAGFVASTLNVSTADFLANKLGFNTIPGAGNVVNQGEITTPSGGAVYLVGTHVTNAGIITTPQGETILAAGQTVSLIDTATPGVKVEITGAAGDATNLGTIVADAGRIGIAGVIVRNSGTLNASSAVSEGGRIFLRASQDAYVDGNGRIITTGTTGGHVEVLGERVAVMDNASIDASGMGNANAGGGTILVGGDYQGKNPDIQNASITWFGPDATLKADAQNLGAGGTVIVWADDTTRAFGTISARGGANGGDGGFVETSGHNYLAVDGIRVDTRAPQGQVGTWLLDPSDIIITSSGTTAVSTTMDSVPYGGPTTTEFTTGAGSSSTISDTTINGQLTTTDVIIHTGGGTGGSGNITADGVNISNVGGYALILAAYGGGTATGNINILNSSIAVEDGITLLAGWDGGPISYGPDGNTLSSANVIGGKGNIIIQDSTLESFGSGAASVWLFAGNNIELKSIAAPTQVQADTIDVVARGLKLTAGNSGSGTGRVELSATGTQNIAINNGGLLQLQGGSGGDGNYASINGGTQNITFDSGGTLNLFGGSGIDSFDNYAKIGAMTGDQVIHAEGVAITLTGGSSGGTSSDTTNDAGIHLNSSNSTGSQTVYAGSITINGGSAAYGGAGFGVENGNSQTFYVTGDLTMNGGGTTNNADFRATPVYIGSEYGGSTINVNVDGSIILNGGSGTAGGVLIGGLDDSGGPTSVTLNAGKNIIATGNTGGVWLGVKNLGSATGNTVTLRAGANAYGGPGGYGGDITMSGPVGIQVDGDTGDISIAAYESSTGAYGGVTLDASTAVYGGYIEVVAGGDNDIAGTLISTGSIYFDSGWDAYGGVSTLRGGNLTLAPTSNVAAGSYIEMYSQAGANTPYAGGNITQAGSLTGGGYGESIYMYADRDININGSVTSNGDMYLEAGYSETNQYGGSVVFGSTSQVAAYGGSIDTYAYSGAESRGDIVQYGGSIYSDSGIDLYADGSVKLNGRVETPGDMYIYAGLDNFNGMGDPYYNSFYGGDIALELGSAVYGGGYMEFYANRGFDATYGGGTGNITQDAVGQLHLTNSETSFDAYAAGNVALRGTVTADSSYQSFNINAGYDYPGDCYDQCIQDKYISINSFNALGSYASLNLYATGQISANTQDADSIYADIYNSNSGGIVINNSGAAQPSSVELYDYAATNRSIAFTHTGSDLALDANYYFETFDPGTNTVSGSISIAAPSNNLTYSSVGSLYGDSVILAAWNQLNIDGSLYNSYGDLALIATTVNVTNSVSTSGTLDVIAGTLNNMTSSGTLSAGTDLTMIAGNINGTDGAHFQAGNNLNAVVANNITLLDGAHFHAGNDINLALAGAGSTVSMTNVSFMHANAPTTIHIDFAARSAGGIFINGVETTTNASDGTGFFIGSGYPPTPAVPGAGLEITYANSANQAILAVFDSNSGQAGETEEERQRRLQQTDDNGESHDPADKPVAQCS